MTAVRRALGGLRWYLDEVTGESRWRAYLARCAEEDVAPMTRREYERHRTEVREHHPQSRCC